MDARRLTPEQQACLDDAGFRRRHGMPPLAGELGCYLSHVEVMRRFLAGDAEFALVLEDDVLLHDSLPAVLQGLIAHAGRWDAVKLSAVHRGTPVRVLEVAPGHHLAVMLSRVTGSSAYLMNRKAAAAWLKEPGGLLPMTLPYDHVFDQGWTFGLQVRMVTPTPCIHDEEIATTITTGGASRKFAWWRRLRAHAYRLGNELRRVRYGLGERLRESRRPRE